MEMTRSKQHETPANAHKTSKGLVGMCRDAGCLPVGEETSRQKNRPRETAVIEPTIYSILARLVEQIPADSPNPKGGLHEMIRHPLPVVMAAIWSDCRADGTPALKRRTLFVKIAVGGGVSIDAFELIIRHAKMGTG
jgi:hypothetical protein